MSDSKLFKGSLATVILKLLEDGGKMYGYEITQKVKALSKGKFNITEGALYPALHKLEGDGLLEVEVMKVDNRMRKYYRLTKKGNKETAKKLAELEEFLQALTGIINIDLKIG